MDCRVFRRSLYHYQADEMAHAERESFERHLNACPTCADLLDVEEGMLRGLRARLQPTAAPPGLETRIRAQLEQSRAVARPGAGWLRSPWFAAIAASLLLAVLLVPSRGLFRTASSQRVSHVVVLVDRACDEAGAGYEAQRDCTHPKHLNALKLEDGTYWELSLDHDAARDLVTNREQRGTRLLVEGLLYEKIQTLQLESVRPIGQPSAKLVLPGL